MGNKENWTAKYGPIQKDYIGDFIGFTWDGMSMSRLGITRTSDGDRYNDNLTPTMQNKITTVPGEDGTYYFGSNYTQKPFNINFAFEGLTEKGLRQLKQLFGDKGLHRLTYDEWPYKEYIVKVTGQPQIKYIPFDDERVTDDSTKVPRIYKGEGTLNLTAFYPYAKSRAGSLSELEVLGKEEDIYLQYSHQWKDDVYPPPPPTNKIYNQFSTATSASTGANLYNPGDLETDFTLQFNINDLIDLPIQIILKESMDQSGELPGCIIAISIPERKTDDVKIRFNSKTELLEGLDKYGKLTGNLYNDCIKAGDFFKIPTGESYILISKIVATDEGSVPSPEINYNYLYY